MKTPFAGFSVFTALMLVLGFNSTSSLANQENDLDKAPPSFTLHNYKVIPVDFQKVDLHIDFDVPSKKATGHSRIEFLSEEDGNPMLELVPPATKVVLDGENLGAEALETMNAPANAAKVTVLTRAVSRRTPHVLEIWYDVPAKTVTFTSTGVRMVWAMSDLSAEREYLEQYAPANLEFDQFQMDFTFTIHGAGRAHEVFANGAITQLANDQWKIAYPKFYTASSFFFHVTDKTVTVERSTFEGVNGSVPLTVYSEGSSTSVSSSMKKAKDVMKELEETYGPYAHDSMTIYLNSVFGGGMEHCGATITSPWALSHEVTHSWFARGVMPSGGNSGWIDEAIASWRDNKYPKKHLDLDGSAVNLAAFSPYYRTTPPAAYTKGATLLAGLDELFANGLKPVLKELFAQYKYQTITTPMFEKHLNRHGGKDVSDHFKRYVYNDGHPIPGQEKLAFLNVVMPRFEVPEHMHHPRPFTQAEIEALR